MADATVETELLRVGRSLAAAYPSPARHPLRALEARVRGRALADPQLRAALFRFVDVVPACRSADDVAGHLASLLGEVDRPPAPVAGVLRAEATPPGRAALGASAPLAVRRLARRFIAGPTPAAALPELSRLWRAGVASSLDLLGEATVADAEADAYAARCHAALDALAAAARDWPPRSVLERDGHGALPRASLSVKASALTARLRPGAPGRARDDAAPRLRRLLAHAAALDAHVHVDMEALDTREAVQALALETLAEPAFADGPSAGVVVQAYLADADQQLEQVLGWARAHPRRRPLVVRLVKGAYWDQERALAAQQGWPSPVRGEKADSDRAFERMTRRLLEARGDVRVAVASHNLRSVAHAIGYSRALGGADADLELQVLRGLGDDLARALAREGFRVRAYCPVGDLVAGMAYLVRRLLENSANDSFLATAAAGAPLDRLLAPP